MGQVCRFGLAAGLALWLAACQTTGAVAPPALRSPQAEFGLALEPIREPMLVRYQPFGEASLRATQEMRIGMDGSAIARRDVLHGAMEAEPAGEGLVRVTSLFFATEAELSPFLPLHPFLRVSLMTDLGEVRSEEWTFEESDRVTRPQALEIANMIESLFPRLPWPERELSTDMVAAFNAAGPGGQAPTPMMDRIQLHAAQEADGDPSIILTFANPGFRPPSGGEGETLAPTIALNGFIRVDPATGFPVEVRAVGRGGHMVEGRRLDFELRFNSVLVRGAQPGS